MILPTKKTMKDQSGQVVIIVALAMVLLLGIAALAIDLGGIYEQARHLQTAADASALAGAAALAHLPAAGDPWASDPASPWSQAKIYAETNWNRTPKTGSPTLTPWPPDSTADPTLQNSYIAITRTAAQQRVEVHLRESSISVPFGSILDRIWKDGASTNARAVAEVKALIGTKKIFPVISNYYVDRLRLKLTRSGASSVTYDLTKLPADTDPDYTRFTGSYPANLAAGYWDATLESVDSEGHVYARWSNVGRLHVLAAANETRIVSMQRIGTTITPGGSYTLLVAAPAKPTVTVSGGSVSMDATATGQFVDGLRVWRGQLTVNKDQGNTGDYQAGTITVNGAPTPTPTGRFVEFHSDKDDQLFDVPLVSFELTPSTKPVSMDSTATFSVLVRTQKLAFNKRFLLKIEANLAQGDRRLVDTFVAKKVDEMITAGFLRPPDTSDAWVPTCPPLVLDQKLVVNNQSGQKKGLVKKGWSDRQSNAVQYYGWNPTDKYTRAYLEGLTEAPDIAPNDPNFIVVPITYYRNGEGDGSITYADGIAPEIMGHPITLAGYSNETRIAMFAGYYVTEPVTDGGAMDGVFVKSIAQGNWWPPPPPSDLYLQTVVLTK